MKISVIITAFNGAKYLPMAIESFLAQSYENKELVIIDGISSDSSFDIISNYQKKFPQLVKWVKEKDSGISNARNIALKHVTGDVVGFLGCDDILHKNFFSEFAYYAELNPAFDVAYFNSYCIGFSNSFSNSATISLTKRNLIKHCPIGSGESFYYRREIFAQHQFNEKNRYCMDYELNMELASCHTYHFFPINITAVFNQNIGTNQSSANSLKQRLESVAVQLKYAKGIRENLLILWHTKKLVLKNFPLFLECRVER
ncbi:MAG: glycosyltransferase [Alphaproteobacteria bacterium]|nr:glycosyltransferase [Alphaproteobacteria bacterium]